MDRYDKWETHYNRFYGMPFHGESAGTSHFRFGVAPHDVGPGYEYGFAGRPGNSSTSADYYAASQEEFTQSYSDGNQQPGNTFMPDAKLDKDNDLDDSDKVSLLNLPPFSPYLASLSILYESLISITV